MKKTILLALVPAFIISLIPRVVEAKLVACIGDSNTEGHGLSDPTNDCYPAQLERLLRQFDPNWETRNFGVGTTTVLSQGDFPYSDTSAYAEALESEPDVVILCFGPNGSRLPNRGKIEESYISDYITLIDAFAALPSEPEIWICYPLKAFSAMYSISDEIIRDQIIPLITQVASEKELPIIDFYEAFENSRDLLQFDGIHPNPEGTRLMAEIVSAFLTGVKGNPDLNNDGIVDSADLCIVVDHWLTNEPSCDIAPPPFGDGIVDVQDLVALAEYLFVYPWTVAYWELDETEGNVAYDSAADHNGTLVNDPVWQPSSGMADGALLFDGIDDYVSTDFVLNPAESRFSVFAWIKDGAPDQVILSQIDGANWFSADLEGKLMTELIPPKPSRGTAEPPLISGTIITDANWHRVGIVWDGSYRILYVDGIEVARDTAALELLEFADGGLYIGTDKNLDEGTFFSGLIDDVRIYNVALSAEQIAALAQ
jgi:lysophospholipase L1-like esterase